MFFIWLFYSQWGTAHNTNSKHVNGCIEQMIYRGDYRWSRIYNYTNRMASIWLLPCFAHATIPSKLSLQVFFLFRVLGNGPLAQGDVWEFTTRTGGRLSSSFITRWLRVVNWRSVLQWVGKAMACLRISGLSIDVFTYRQDCWMYFERSQHNITAFDFSTFTLQLEVSFSHYPNSGQAWLRLFRQNPLVFDSLFALFPEYTLQS